MSSSNQSENFIEVTGAPIRAARCGYIWWATEKPTASNFVNYTALSLNITQHPIICSSPCIARIPLHIRSASNNFIDSFGSVSSMNVHRSKNPHRKKTSDKEVIAVFFSAFIVIAPFHTCHPYYPERWVAPPRQFCSLFEIEHSLYMILKYEKFVKYLLWVWQTLKWFEAKMCRTSALSYTKWLARVRTGHTVKSKKRTNFFARFKRWIFWINKNCRQPGYMSWKKSYENFMVLHMKIIS